MSSGKPKAFRSPAKYSRNCCSVSSSTGCAPASISPCSGTRPGSSFCQRTATSPASLATSFSTPTGEATVRQNIRSFAGPAIPSVTIAPGPPLPCGAFDQLYQQPRRRIKPRNPPPLKSYRRRRRAHNEALQRPHMPQSLVQVVRLETQVICPATGLAQHRLDRRVRRQWRDQLNLRRIARRRFGLRQEVHRDFLNWVIERPRDHLGSKQSRKHLRRRIDLRHRHPHMQQLESQAPRQTRTQSVAPFCSSAFCSFSTVVRSGTCPGSN